MGPLLRLAMSVTTRRAASAPGLPTMLFTSKRHTLPSRSPPYTSSTVLSTEEFGARAGTENVAGDIGFAVALDKAQSMRSEETARLKKLQAECIRQLEKTLPDVRINGSQKFRLPANIHVTIPGQDNERLLLMLDEAGILAGAGSACNASSEESSHVLHALGLDDAAAHASLRFTMGRTTSASDIKTTVRVLARSIQSA